VTTLPPNVFEPIRRQRGIPRRRIDRAMAQIGLERAGIDALVGQGVPAGMPQHVLNSGGVRYQNARTPSDLGQKLNQCGEALG
jgi:hypothetical protein